MQDNSDNPYSLSVVPAMCFEKIDTVSFGAKRLMFYSTHRPKVYPWGL